MVSCGEWISYQIIIHWNGLEWQCNNKPYYYITSSRKCLLYQFVLKEQVIIYTVDIYTKAILLLLRKYIIEYIYYVRILDNVLSPNFIGSHFSGFQLSSSKTFGDMLVCFHVVDIVYNITLLPQWFIYVTDLSLILHFMV